MQSRPPFFVAATRVVLVTIPTAALDYRLQRDDDFVVATAIDAAGTQRDVRFPAAWPGNLVAHFPKMLERRKAGETALETIGALVERASLVAVGDMGTHAAPDRAGVVEIGYDVGTAFRNRGYATEMLAAFAAWLLARDDVALVTAEVLANNYASIRVLERSGFARTGSRVDAEGPLTLWERRR